MVTNEKVKAFALSAGADLTGIAPVERFTGAPAGHHPSDVLPGARSVISCAQQIPAGAVAGPPTSYQAVMNAIHTRLDSLAVRVALFLEDHGGRAVPVPSDEPYWDWDADRSHGAGDLSHKHAAQAAGLGKLGRSSLLVTPRFGNRVHLVSIVTDLAIAPDPLLDWEPCPEGCAHCIEACPAGAIGEGSSVDQSLCRPVTMQRLAKGGVVEACRACRASCRWGCPGVAGKPLAPPR